MAYHAAEEKYGSVTVGPLSVVRACKLCKWHDHRRKGGAGRGAGFREGNMQRGRLIQHIKEAHPVEYAAAMKEAKERRAAFLAAKSP
jgi:hypothetical protein